VHAIETGKFAPSLTLAFKIATLFGTDINELFAPDPEDTLPSLLENPHAYETQPNRPDDRGTRSRPLVFFGKPRIGGDGPDRK
jgi:transcriptional regulator with XRE-family HTH domain